jgi:hypothetical protein
MILVRLVASNREAGEEASDLEPIIEQMLSGQYRQPVRVIAFNTAEGWARDVRKMWRGRCSSGHPQVVGRCRTRRMTSQSGTLVGTRPFGVEKLERRTSIGIRGNVLKRSDRASESCDPQQPPFP